MVSEKAKTERRWTGAQRKAIEYSGDNLMLLAAAGSGKTSVLTERVLHLITECGAELSRMLIVTYTNAAADELRERIRSALAERLRTDSGSVHLRRQLIALEHAEICTIHSFCMSALKPYFAQLSLPPDFRVSDEATAKKLRAAVMTEVTDSFFAAGDERIVRLADCFGAARDETYIDGVLLSVADGLTELGMDASSLMRWADDMESSADSDFFSTVYGEEARRTVVAFFEHYGAMFTDLLSSMKNDAAHPVPYKNYGAAAEDCIRFCRIMKDAAEHSGYDAAGKLLREYEAVGLKKVSANDQTSESLMFREARKDFKKKADKLSSSVFGVPQGEVSRLLRRSGGLCRDCGAVLEMFFTRYTEEKHRRGVVDFSDLEMYAAKIFVGEDGVTDEAREMQRKYDYVFVDEYQDTNAAQDAVFAAVAGKRGRFLVGDMKQSIYGFRGASPEVFASYRDRWGGGDGGDVIFMSDNFRCDEPVIDLTNLVFARLFPFSSTPFEMADRLRAGKEKASEGEAAEVCVIEKSAAGDNAEAAYVADRIAGMLRTGTRRDGVPLQPDDFAVLLRSSAAREDFEKELMRRGIPVKSKKSEPFYENPSVRLVLCLLHAADNPSADVYLAGAMKSPVFGFCAADLAAVRDYTRDGTLWYAVRRYCGIISDLEDSRACALEYSEELALRLREFCEAMSAVREKARGGSAVRFVGYIYEKFGIMHLCRDTCRELDQKALRRLYEEARSKCADGFCSLYGFLNYIDALAESGKKSGEEEDGGKGVSVITVHHSKGLEFPVCFVSDTGRTFNKIGYTDNVLLDAHLGMAARIPDEGGLIRCDTPLRQAISARRRRADMEEEMRVLYVAMTRAREKLIITGQHKDPEALIRTEKNMYPYTSEYSVTNSESMLRWIVGSLASPDASEVKYKLSLVLSGASSEDSFAAESVDADENRETVSFTEPAESDADLSENAKTDETENMSDCSEKTDERVISAEEYGEIFAHRFSFVYPYAPYTDMPAKLTVSKLYPGLLDDDEVRGSIDRSEASPTVTRSVPLPRFMENEKAVDGAERGTATHVFMQFCSFEALSKDGTDSETARLLREGFITERMAELIQKEDIEKFRRSDFFRRMLCAKRMWREFRFNAAMPAADFTMDEALRRRLKADEAKVTVQGVVDCMFEDASGKIVLADYKTDHLTGYELTHPEAAAAKLTERHKTQLTYYREICSAMLCRPVDETYIYSLPLGDAIPLI